MRWQMRPLGAADDAQLRALWQPARHAHIFAICDLDHLGWADGRLHFVGWFNHSELIGYLMLYGVSAQWYFIEEEIAPEIADILTRRRVQFITGLESTAWPVVELLPPNTLGRYEASTVAVLPAPDFQPHTMEANAGTVQRATLDDLDDLATVHVAAPDQFNNFDFDTRKRLLRSLLSDGWRRIYLARDHDGRPAAAAQTSAEGEGLAIIGGVVTDPAMRGQGHGTAVTAHLCQALLKENKIPYLFYRRDNRAAERVYEKIGFYPLDNALIAELNWTYR